MIDHQDSIKALAAHVAEAATRTLPQSVVTATTASIADTMSCMVAGSSTDVVARVRRVANAWGGRKSSRVVGMSDRLPPYLAAWVNASMTHQHDFDDTHDEAVCHPTSGSLAAASALADSVGGVDGATLVRAVAVGNDVTCRLGLAIDGTLWDFPWVRAPVVGIFGAVASAAVVLGLDSDRTHQAFGLALPQVGGTLESVVGGDSDVRSIRDGLAYKDAVLAACLAAEGVRGDQRVLDGPYGLGEAHFGGRWNPHVLTRDLGAWFPGADVSLKPWPTCRHTHATLTALLAALEDLGADSADVDSVEVAVGRGNERLTRRPWPSTPIDAMCNLEFVLAVAVARGDVAIRDLQVERLDAEDVRAAAQRITWRRDPAQDRHGTIEPGDVTIVLADGTRAHRTVEHSLGHPSAPMPQARRARKLATCGAAAGVSWSFDECVTYLDGVDALWEAHNAEALWALPPW